MGPETANAPDLAEAYRQGIEADLASIPRRLRAEADARGQYDPERIAQQQYLQAMFGTTQYGQQLDAAHQLDPESWAVRSQLASRVQGDLDQGYNLPEDYSRELTNTARGAQAARGNSLGTGAGNAETAYRGNAALEEYNRRLGRAGSFLSSPTPTQQISLIQGVQPDRTSAFTNPNAGIQGVNMAQQSYQNMLAQGAQPNPWANALGGAASGAAAGGQVGGGWGSLVGGVVGGAAGYFSDPRLKEDIREVGEMNGFKLFDFRFKSDPLRRLCRGVMADQVQKIKPEAVGEENGFLTVNYEMLGIPFVEVG